MHALDYVPNEDCPLDGIRILDLSRLVAGNMLSLLLADFGADVIKVEDPDQGDTLRHWKDYTNEHPEGVSTYWKVYGRNKRSLTLNLRKPEGIDILLRLVKQADVLIESFKPGTLEKIGVGPATLHEHNPALVIVRVSGWGQTGPYRNQPGFGSLVEAMSGYAAKNGFESQPPMLPNLALADMVAGVYGAFSTMVALRAASDDGKGQEIDLSLLEPLLSILGPDAAQYSLTGLVPSRVGNRTSISAPRNVYKTKDHKYVALSASVQSMTVRLFHTINRPELIDDPRFRTNSDRLDNIDALDAIIQDFVSQYTQEESLAFFRENAVTVGPVYDVGELVEDKHIIEREVIIDVPDQQLGSLTMHNIIPRLSRTPGRLRRPAPELGQDTLAVLSTINIGTNQCQSLKSEGII